VTFAYDLVCDTPEQIVAEMMSELNLSNSGGSSSNKGKEEKEMRAIQQ
jgi:hypothetical protein